MIYISYKFCNDVVYKALEGNELKLETFVMHNENNVKMKFVTDKRKKNGLYSLMIWTLEKTIKVLTHPYNGFV